MKSAENSPGSLTTAAINDAAAKWLARREDGLNLAQADEFARWRDADPRHAAAFLRAEATHRLLMRLPHTPAAAAMLAEVDALQSPPRQVTLFSTFWKTAIGVAAAASIALVMWNSHATRAGTTNATYATLAGQHQSIALPDGSTLILNSGSKAEVAFASAERRIRLQQGEAHFYVAKDAARPFVVTADSVTIRAVGTAFNVRRQAAAIEVLVTEGKVKVSREDAPHLTPRELEPIYLAAGERASIESVLAANLAVDQQIETSPRSVQRAPRLMFNNTPLSEVIERFNQYSHVQMEIGDADLASRSVGGNFDADNAESFINLLRTAGDVRVERISENRVLLLKAQ